MKLSRVGRTLLSAAFELEFEFDFMTLAGQSLSQNQIQRRRTRVSAPHLPHQFKQRMVMAVNLAPDQQEQILAAARAAFKNAHAPYSNFKVGATILAESGARILRLQRGERILRSHHLRRAQRHLCRRCRRRNRHEDQGSRRCNRTRRTLRSLRRLSSGNFRIRSRRPDSVSWSNWHRADGNHNAAPRGFPALENHTGTVHRERLGGSYFLNQ